MGRLIIRLMGLMMITLGIWLAESPSVQSFLRSSTRSSVHAPASFIGVTCLLGPAAWPARG